MNKMKILAAAIAFAAAGSANAAIELANTENSSLVLAVWDNVAQESYIRDLGYNLLDFTPDMVSTDAGHTFNFSADPLFSSLFGDNDAANIYWNVTAADGIGPGATSGRQIISTAAFGAEASSFSVSNTGINSGATYWTTFFQNANTQPSPDGTTCATSMSCYSTDPGDLQYAGDDSWGAFWAGSLTSLNSAGTLGQSLGFYSFTPNSGLGFQQSDKARYENAYGIAAWTLAADGSLIYSLAGAPTAVPVPAAAWLLGSGLVGLVGVARRRAAK
ncbi:MAG: VPLPA-CTERM sorting domain-containing protein [Pseudomonadota bacterium]